MLLFEDRIGGALKGRVVMGGVVKANGRANLRVTPTLLRDARGLLVDLSQDVARAGKTDVGLLPALKTTSRPSSTNRSASVATAPAASTCANGFAAIRIGCS